MKALSFLTLFLLLFPWPFSGAAQDRTHFYNVDTETTLEGRVEEILLEPRYENTANFLVLIVKSI